MVPEPALPGYIPINSSGVICESLPDSLPSSPLCPKIHILKHPEQIKVSYEHVTDLVPKLLSKDRHIDVVLHLGLAGNNGPRQFNMEWQSKRGIYGKMRDVDRKICPVEQEPEYWSKCPEVLQPTFNLDDVWERWTGRLKEDGVDARKSRNPGDYLCGFIYYASMAWYSNEIDQDTQPHRPVMFVHVPDLPKEEDIAFGKKVVIAMIQALVESLNVHGAVDPLKDAIEIPASTNEK